MANTCILVQIHGVLKYSNVMNVGSVSKIMAALCSVERCVVFNQCALGLPVSAVRTAAQCRLIAGAVRSVERRLWSEPSA